MIVCTATLLFVLLVFAPIRIKINAQIYLKRLQADMQATVFGIKVFDETAKLRGKNIICSGTVQTEIDLTQIDTESGVNILNCITVDKVFVSFQNNLSYVSAQTILAENVICALATVVACGMTNCNVASNVLAYLGENRVCIKVAVSVNVAELSFCLLKQGVQLWTRKLAKS